MWARGLRGGSYLRDSGCEAPMKEKHSGKNSMEHPDAEEL